MAKTKKLNILSLFLAVIVMITAVVPITAFAEASVLDAPELKSYCNLTSDPVLYWKKVKKATCYRVYRSDSKDGKYKKIATTDKLNFTDKKANVKKTYYYKVRSINNADKKVVVGKVSNIVKQKAMKTVLVGDSIMCGVKEYNALPHGSFIAKVGIGPNSFYNFAYSEYKINGKASKGVDKVISTKANRVIIMLGMNEIDWNSTKSTVNNYRKVLKKIKKNLPNAEIIVLATSPTAKNHSSGVPSLKKVKVYNKSVKKLAKELDIKYVNLFEGKFTDSNGYLKNKYNGGDGCHWNVAGTKKFISLLTDYVKKN